MNNSDVLWITGYQGFIGSHLLASLIDEFKLIGCIGRDKKNNNYSIKAKNTIKLNGEINLENLENLKNRSSEPNIIFHLAGCSSVFQAEKNIINSSTENIFAISSLLEFCRLYAKDALLIVISSPAVFGQNKRVLNMKSDEKPLSMYGLQKSFLEQMCNYYNVQYGLKIKIARVYSCYGKGLKKQFLWDLCHKLTKTKEPILFGTGEEIRDFIHVKDTVKALKLFMNSDDSLQYLDIGNGGGMTLNDIANSIYKNLLIYRNLNVHKYNFSGTKSTVSPNRLVADTKELFRLGYKQSISFIEGSDEYCRWFCNLSN